MIISSSRRTDIPAYYADWLMGRIEAGYCLVRNPFDARVSTRVSLVPEDIDFLVLWTRDPRPLFPYLSELESRGIRFYVQMTLIGYPSAIEPESPSLDEAISAFRALSRAIGASRALWRYDPIFVAEGLGEEFHLRNFDKIASALEGHTERVSLSLLDEYAHTASRLDRAGFPGAVFGSVKAQRGDGSQATAYKAPPLPYAALLADLAAIASSRGMAPVSCAEPYDLSASGIEAGACVDARLAASLWGREVPQEPSGQRPVCGCARSVDIGAYGTCPRGCVYCYASRGRGRLVARGRIDEAL